ncbi:glycosyltransferase [Leptolinea tardivitalis]|uniref:Glycosyltransferase 2-like domain-containing protein n=1 Tax=Leptolinea tardivitalis TaxID=229920 RepID=A0A0P6XVR9_9CHLR|nr:glycosyltransferase [Leptolinea tardivitalis]KPL73447.1 hypothetical protein ADM99_04440 [Leptolinea tardivitalis]GAP21608.1 predicted glycosyltransferases [Leptolinea tardivitalis]
MKIDIIICSNRSSDTIKACLNRLLNILPEEVSIIVVLPINHPFLSNINIYHPRIRFIGALRENISYQRNLGLSNSTAEIIGFLDDDTILQKDHVKKIIDIFSTSNSIIGIGGRVVNYQKTPTILHIYRKFFGLSISTKDGTSNQLKSGFFNFPDVSIYPKEVQALWGCCMWWRRDYIIDCRFNEQLSAFQDIEFSYQVNYKGKLILIEDAEFIHLRMKENRSEINRLFSQVSAAKKIALSNKSIKFSYLYWCWSILGLIFLFFIYMISQNSSLFAAEYSEISILDG